MKTFIFFFILLLSSYTKALSEVYRTAANGDLSDASSWTFTRHERTLEFGDTLIVQHKVTISYDLIIEGTLIINPLSSLGVEARMMFIQSTGIVVVNGLLKAKNFNNDGLIINNSRVEVYGNFINNGEGSRIDGTNGFFRLTINAINNARADIKGTVDFCRFDEVTDPTVWRSGTIDWSTVTICGQNPMPVTFVSLEANKIDDRVLVKWVTSQEENNDRFELEKSNDGVLFNYVASVNGAGNSALTNHYQAYDQSSNAMVYYRLKQVDVDGKYTYSEIAVLGASANDEMMVYPNPKNREEDFRVNISNNLTEHIFITVVDHNGQVLVNNEEKLVEGNYFVYNPSCMTKTGIYFIAIHYQDKLITKKVVVK